jgi:glutamate transport system permease protein
MDQQQTVLYDVPGPRARRITWIGSVVAAIAVAVGIYFFVYKPLDERGQFDMALWGPIIDPGHPEFTPVWKLLGEGFWATIKAAGLAILTSLIVGTVLAILRIQLKALLRRRFAGSTAAVAYALRGLSWVLAIATRFLVEVFRGIPVVITIFFVWVALPRFGVTFDDSLWYLVIGLTIYNSVVIGEILRSGMEGLPSGQREAADALGLSPFQTTRMVLLPQAYRIMLPALIGQLVVVLKDTSLGFIIQYPEILRVASGIVQAVTVPNLIQTYFAVGVIYFVVNYALSRLAQYTQRRLARGRKTAGLPAQERPALAVTAEATAGARGGGPA